MNLIMQRPTLESNTLHPSHVLRDIPESLCSEQGMDNKSLHSGCCRIKPAIMHTKNVYSFVKQIEFYDTIYLLSKQMYQVKFGIL